MRNFVYFDRFQAGETGLHGDWLDGFKLFRGILIYSGTFHASNIQRNMDGTVGPRPGLWPVPVTGLPTGVVTGYTSTDFPGRDGLVIIGNQVWGFNHQSGGAAFQYTGTLASVPTAPVAMIQSGPTFVYATSQGDKTYAIDVNAKTVTAIPNSPGGKVIAIYQDRLAIANLGGTNTNRVVFSDPFAPGGTPQFTFNGNGVTLAPSTQVTAGSNGVNVSTFAGAGVLNVVSTTGYSTTGTLSVDTASGPQLVTYTGTTGTTFTGCTSSGSGVLFTGANVDLSGGLTYFDVSDAWDVNALVAQRTYLAVGKQMGWWVYQGSPGVNAVLRKVIDTDGPKEPLHVAHLNNGALYYIPIFADLPAVFTGVAVQQARNLRFANGAYTVGTLPTTFGAVAQVQPSDLMLVAGQANSGAPNMAAEAHNGAWAFHQFGVNISGYVAYGGGNGVYLCDGGAGGVVAKFYVFPTELDRPVKLGDTYGTPGDGLTPAIGNTANTNSLELPEWEARDGSEVVIRAVHVSFKKWNTGFTQSNHFDVTVTSTSQFNKAGSPQGQASATQSWDEAASVTSSDGQYQHKVFRFADQTTGNGFKLKFANLRGVAIKKIQVVLDVEPTRS